MNNVPLVLTHHLSMGVTGHLALLNNMPFNDLSNYEHRGACILVYSF